MDDLVLEKLNLNVFGSNFGVYPTPPLSPLSFQAHHGEGSYFPDVRYALTSPGSRLTWRGRKDTFVVDHRHEALKALLGGNIVHKPRRSPRTVLDLAAGNGAWVVDVAEEFPTADEVVGVDIRPATPLKMPLNCRFEVYLVRVRG